MNLMNLDPETRDYLIQQYRLSGDPAMARAVKVADMAGGALDAYSGLTDDFVVGGQNLLHKLSGTTPSIYGPEQALQGPLVKGVDRVMPTTNGLQRGIGRFAGSGAFRGAMRALPALGAISGVAAAGDILTGEESAANKAMDLTLGAAGAAGALKMGAMGAAAGSVVPGIGTAVGGLGGLVLGGLGGFGLGKTASDVFQYVGGDKKTAEERRMEGVLKQIRGII